MQCVTINEFGNIIVVDPQPVDWSTCALVLQSGAEAGANPFYLSAEDGALLAWAIVGVWSAALIFRLLIVTMKGESHAE